MKLTCPGCGAIGSLELFTADVDAREFAQLMGRVPPELAKPLQRYLSLFRPPRQGTGLGTRPQATGRAGGRHRGRRHQPPRP